MNRLCAGGSFRIEFPPGGEGVDARARFSAPGLAAHPLRGATLLAGRQPVARSRLLASTTNRPESERLWLDRPDLRIVSDAMWHTAHARLRGTRLAMAPGSAERVSIDANPP
jgi:hypothetical protein